MTAKIMNKTKAFFLVALCLILILSVCFTFEIRIFASTRPNTYVEDIKLYVTDSGDDAANNAKSWFEKQGYQFSGIELNQGTKTSKDVYLGYKTTTNRDMAITDIRMLGMDTGYQLYDYKGISDYFASLNKGTAQTMYASANKFTDNYKAGSPKAQDAYKGLNLFYVGTKSTKLGDYILNGKASVSFFTKMLTKASSGTLNAVISFLNIGVANFENSYDDKKGTPYTENWAQLVSQSELWNDFEEGLTTEQTQKLHKKYNDKARELFAQVQSFTTLYENAVSRYSEADLEQSAEEMENASDESEKMDKVEEKDADVLYIAAFKELNSYKAHGKTKLGDFLIDLGHKTSDEVDLMQLYPVIEAMGDNQTRLAIIGGILSAVNNLSENKTNERLNDSVEEAKKAINDYNKGDAISVWDSADDDIDNAKIAFTSDAVRKKSAQEQIGKVTKFEVLDEKLSKAFEVINIVVGAAFVAGAVLKVIANFVLKKVIQIITVAAVKAILTTVFTGLLKLALALSAFSKWVGLVVLAFSIGWMIGKWIASLIKEKVKDLGHTDKPDYVFDAPSVGKDAMNIKYYSVRGQDSKVADMNASKQYRWEILTYSRDTRAGSPLCADENGNIFKCVTGSAVPVNGYDYSRVFGERSPANANSYCEKDNVNGIFLHYRTEASLKNETSEPPKDSEGKTTPTVEKKYLGDMIIGTAKTVSEAKAKIVNHKGKYYTYDVNLSPDAGIATYIGYTITNDPDSAITDLRVASCVGNTIDKLSYGDVVYTRVDTVGFAIGSDDKQTRPACNTLYFTTDKNAGSPIAVDALHAVTDFSKIKDGWEPVSFFGNDLPYNFNTEYTEFQNNFGSEYITEFSIGLTGYSVTRDGNLDSHKGVYLYYEPETKYTSGTKYFSGVFFVNGIDSIDKTGWTNVTRTVGEFKNKMATYPHTYVDGTNLANAVSKIENARYDNVQTYLGYTYTFNPKRAAYHVAVFQGDTYSDSLPYTMSKKLNATDSRNYVAAPIFSQAATKDDIGKEFCSRYTTPGNAFINNRANLYILNYYKEQVEAGYTKTLPDGISCGYQKLHYQPTEIYICGYKKGSKPMTMNDVVITTKECSATENGGYISFDVSGEKTVSGEAAKGAFSSIYDLKNPHSKKAFDLSYSDFYLKDGDKDKLSGSRNSLFMYISGAKKTKGKYITSLSVGAYSREQYKQTKPNANEDELKGVDAVTDCQALAQAAGGCTDEVIVTNMSIADQNNAWYNRSKDGVSERTPPANNPASYIGVNRTDDLTDEKAITGILLYKLNDTVAPNKVEIDDIEYICAGAQVPIIMNGQSYYLYYTYNEGATPGVPVEDIKIDTMPLISGYATNLCGAKDKGMPFGNPSQTTFIHMKYEHTDGEFFNKFYLGLGSDPRAALCNLVAQGCVEFVNMDMNKGVAGSSVYLGFRRGRIDHDLVDSQDEEDRADVLQEELKEAAYDIIVTKDEPFRDGGFVHKNVYYAPVSNRDLTNGQGNRLYMYYTCPYLSAKYNRKNNVDTVLPQDNFTGYIDKLALAQYDRVPYNTSLSGTGGTKDSIMPWEYVMYSDYSAPAEFNEGTVSHDTQTANNRHSSDNRVTMFAQRSDGSVKPAGEITGGFVSKTTKLGTAYIEY